MYTSRDSLSRLEEVYPPERYGKVFNRGEEGRNTYTHTRAQRRYPAIKAIEAIRIKNRGIYTVGVKGQS